MMVLSDFVLTHTAGVNPLSWEYFAEVDVTTGALWWKKTRRRAIRREYGGSWHFIDTGEYTPGFQAETLERAFKAERALCAAQPPDPAAKAA